MQAEPLSRQIKKEVVLKESKEKRVVARLPSPGPWP